MTDLPQTLVYKILSAPDYAAAKALGYSKTALDEGDGYVHLSTREQVQETLSLHYPGQTEVRLLEYVVEHFSGEVRWEESRGGKLFPHLYSTLRLDAAKRMWVLQNDAAGIPVLPDSIDG
jgi:uncharacterized protein (DUF952 family)